MNECGWRMSSGHVMTVYCGRCDVAPLFAAASSTQVRLAEREVTGYDVVDDIHRCPARRMERRLLKEANTCSCHGGVQ